MLALIDALKVHEMADIKSLLDAIRGIKLPQPKQSLSATAERVKASFSDDAKFRAIIRELSKPRAFTATEVAEIYNKSLDRNQRFAKSMTKKRILDQLAEEREILISNEYAGRVIAAHSGSKP